VAGTLCAQRFEYREFIRREALDDSEGGRCGCVALRQIGGTRLDSGNGLRAES
jgi:hypothetical protein